MRFKKKRKPLGEVLVDLLRPKEPLEPPRGRQPKKLPGWSGLPTDPKPPGWQDPSSKT